MVELLSLEDATRAVTLAVHGDAQGVLNIPGADVLPLSRLIEKHGRIEVPVPGPLLAPLYAMRMLALRSAFSYDLNAGRFHFGNVLDGRRARKALGYEPRVSVAFTPPRGLPFAPGRAVTRSS
jgi:UDP-glucose 4-epimerase